MSFIADFIEGKNNNGEKVLSVFLTSGFPDKNKFTDLALNILNAGADMLEIGFPFSDPLADGPVIQQSSYAALQDGVNLHSTFEYVSGIRAKTDKPLILMGYANPVLSYGVEKFSEDAKKSGVNGVIIPDVPIEEYDNFYGNSFNGLDTVLLITPTTPDERIKLIDEKSSGFIYCVSVSGTTGVRNDDKSASIEFVKKIRTSVKKNKTLVGFGIAGAGDAEKFSRHCDGVIVGSAVIKSLASDERDYSNTLDLIREIKSPLSRA